MATDPTMEVEEGPGFESRLVQGFFSDNKINVTGHMR